MHKKKAGKLQTGSTFPKQYWLAVNGKPKNNYDMYVFNFKTQPIGYVNIATTKKICK